MLIFTPFATMGVECGGDHESSESSSRLHSPTDHFNRLQSSLNCFEMIRRWYFKPFLSLCLSLRASEIDRGQLKISENCKIVTNI